jgi:hypothetical protein
MSDKQKLTIKDLNCGNCTNYKTAPHPIYPYDIHYCGSERISERQKYCTEDKGCASHPLALQVLAASMIEVLERQNSEYAQKAIDSKDINRAMLYAGESIGLGKAIKLLYDGD